MILIMRTIFTVLSLFMIRSYPLFLNYKSNTKELFLQSPYRLEAELSWL